MLLIFASFMSIITVIGRIRIIARRWVGRVIFPMLTALFLLLALLFPCSRSNDDESNESDDDGSGSGFTSGSYVSLCLELSVDRVISFCLVESYLVESQYFQYFRSSFPAQILL